MIKDEKFLRRWEDEFIRSSPPDYESAVRLMDSMLEEARRLGVWPPSDPMEGIEIKIKIAR